FLCEVADPERLPLFEQLLALEIDLRHAAGERFTGEEYQLRFPEYRERGQSVFAARATVADSENPGPAGSHTVPKTIGRYGVQRKLGHGGFGEVFLAHDPVMDRDVAIKIPNSARLATERAREEFIAEARNAARLQHEGIVRVFDFGQDPDG